MSVASQNLPQSSARLPSVRLEVNQGGRTVPYLFDQVDFLIGAVAGCDLRVPGADLPAILCLIARHPDGVRLRRLAPTQVMLLNGQPVSRADLCDGDRLTIGKIDVIVRMEPAVKPVHSEIVDDEPDIDVEKLQAELDERTRALANDRKAFERERDDLTKLRAAWEQEKAVAPKIPVRQEVGADLLQREMAVTRRDEELTRRSQALDAREAEIERHKQEIAAVRQELSDIRQQLHERYQERRDRLAGLQEAVDRAARKVQDSKREHEAKQLEFSSMKSDVERRESELASIRAQLDTARMALESERRRWSESQNEIQADLAARLADISAREDAAASHKATLEARERQYQADLVRLERRTSEVEIHEKAIFEQTAELKSRRNELQANAAELEAQAREVDALRAQYMVDAEELQTTKAQHDARQQQIEERAAVLESQQIALTTLRGKLERMRDEFHQHDRAIEAQRLLNEETSAKITERQADLDRLEEENRAEADALVAERKQVAERQAMMSAAMEKLRISQDRLAADEQAFQVKSRDFDDRVMTHAEHEALLKGRLEQLTQAQAKFDADRQALRERTAALAQLEQAREAQQEQLRRQSEEFAIVRKQFEVHCQELRDGQASLAEREATFVAEVETRRVAVDAERRVLQEQERHLAMRSDELTRLEELQRGQAEQLEKKSLALAEQERSTAQHQAASQEALKREQQSLADARAELDALRKEAHGLLLELPNVELRAGSAVDRLSHAREQLRDQLGEIQAFVRQSHDDLAAAHDRLKHDEAELARKDAELRRLIDEHRQALTTAEKSGESAPQTGDLEGWYRRKMRELSGAGEEAELVEVSPAFLDGHDVPLMPTDRDILSITGPVDPADRVLADALVQTRICDDGAVHAMLVEARRLRRTLRQILLASGSATPYQLAVLESKNFAALELGPFRVVDRVSQTAHETIYRVFDPRRGQESLVRHLSEQSARDAGLREAYRVCFGKLTTRDAHVMGTLETLEIDGRPAIVQEWLVGLPANDWPPLAAAPGVCYRLLQQAALGLAALHSQSVRHGRLTERHLLLTPEGQLKVCGASEPAWLHGGVEASGDDLTCLGHIVAGWCTPSGVRKGPKAKPLPDSMVLILNRLRSTGKDAYPDARALLEDLNRAGDVPANPEAWDRLLRYIREHAQPAAILKQSA